jgi:hypothetical protein
MSHRIVVSTLLATALAGVPSFAADKPQPTAAEKQTVFAQAPNTVAGTITTAPKDGTVTFTPYGQQAPVTMKVDPSIPVFQGDGKISTQGLQPGVNARLHYRPAADLPQVAAVEVLSPQEAATVRQQPQPIVMATPTAQPSPTGQPAQPAQPGATAMSEKDRDALNRSASGSQAGKVKEVGGGTLVLDPYQVAAGDSHLRLDPLAPVFQGAAKTTTSVLRPGADVRVFYKEEGSQPPKVVGVELLDPTQAQQLEQSERNVPKDNGRKDTDHDADDVKKK